MAFRGQYEHSLDSKDRLTIPARFRASLADGVVLSRGLEPCVEVRSVADFGAFEQRHLSELDPWDEQDRLLERRYNAYSHDDRLDSGGRIHLPRQLLEHAGLQGTCVIVGVSGRLEIWNPDRWREHEAAIDELDLRGRSRGARE